MQSNQSLRVASLLEAIQGHPRLEEVTLRAFRGVVEKDLHIRLADMPALSLFRLFYFGLFRFGEGCTRVCLEVRVESLPALQVLHLTDCGVHAVYS